MASTVIKIDNNIEDDSVDERTRLISNNEGTRQSEVAVVWSFMGCSVTTLAVVCFVMYHFYFLRSVPDHTLTDSSIPNISVAFIGNSMMYHNDMPRLLEVISQGHVVQNSIFHGDSSLSRLLEFGNGMYHKFNTANSFDQNVGFYDFGACTVQQLLLGYDDDLDEQILNPENTTTSSPTRRRRRRRRRLQDDGTNPCLENKSYYMYSKSRFRNPHWNYIVMNDYSLNPGRNSTRREGLDVLRDVYVPWFRLTGAIPIFYETYAYWTFLYNLTAFVDVPTMTSVTYAGYIQYVALVSKLLPSSQKPRIAPVGLVFLTVWDENRTLWNQLFQKFDQLHASPLGTLTSALVVFRTLFGYMPDKSVLFQNPYNMTWLWSNARVLQQKKMPDPFPAFHDVEYLYDVVDRVVGHEYLPNSLQTYKHGEDVAGLK